MFFRQKRFLPLISLFFIMMVVFSFVGDIAKKDPSARADMPDPVPLSGSHTPQASEFSNTNILLSFSHDVSRKQQESIEGTVQAHEVRFLGLDNAYLVTVPSGTVTSAVDTLRKQPAVKYAEPDY